MKKKTTVLLALISMCLIVTDGIGAVSASDETHGVVIPVFKINPDGTTTVVETIEGSGPTVVTVTPNEDGSINITKEDRQISEEEKIDDSASILCYKTTIIPSFRAYARCYAFSQRPGAESTSDETHGVVIPVFKINPDGTTTVVETIEGSGPTVVTVIPNEDGSINITREDRQISEGERHHPNACKEIIITPETEIPVNIVNENFSLTADVLKTRVKDVQKPYVKIDKDWRRGYTGAEAWDGYSYPFWW